MSLKSINFAIRRFFTAIITIIVLFSVSSEANSAKAFSNFAKQDAIQFTLIDGREISANEFSDHTLEGMFLALWQDPSYASGEPIYYLVTTSGEDIELDIPSQLAKSFQINLYQGKKILVSGHWSPDQSIFHVTSIDEKSSQLSDESLTAIRVKRGWVIEDGKITGNTPWITVLCKFPDVDDEPHSLEHYQTMYAAEYPGLDHYWREASNNQINLGGSTVTGWYTLPDPSDDYVSLWGTFATGKALTDCIGAADDDIDFSVYYGVNLMFNYKIGTAEGLASCGASLFEGVLGDGGITWTFPGSTGGLANLVHEMGHGYCLPHSYLNGGTNGYLNIWDVMSNSYGWAGTDPTWGFIPKHTIAVNKYHLGWIEESKVLSVVWPYSQQITLERTAQPQTQNFQMVKIMIDETTFFTLETRQLISYDWELPADAVIIHKYDDGKTSIISDNDINSGSEGTMWKVGETYEDAAYGIEFTVVEATPSGFVIDLNIREPVRFVSCDLQAYIDEDECHALLALYSSLDGDNWVNRENWLFNLNPCNWNGVVCTSGHVSSLWLETGLKGSLPSEIGNLRHLQSLNLSSEYVIGEIPPTIGLLTQLKELILHCSLSGPIPIEIGFLNNLNRLSFSNNQLTGPIPPEIGILNKLSIIGLYGNQLTGSIPPELGNLSNLESLDLGRNQLSGSIPLELGQLSKLSRLILSNNLLTGHIPTEIGNLRNLFELNLAENQLSGGIPSELGELRKLWGLFLYRNQLTGAIPPELGQLTNLAALRLDDNHQLSGLIPLTFIDLTSLDSFTFNDTSLCEPIDDSFLLWKDTVRIWNGSGRYCILNPDYFYLPIIIR